MKIYLVWDTSCDELVGVFGNMPAARKKVLSHLKTEAGYLDWEWAGFAEDYGFDSIEAFQAAIEDGADFDKELMMEVEEKEVEN